MRKCISAVGILLMLATCAMGQPLERIRVSDDSTHFVQAKSGERFVIWGVNYDHDADGHLLEDYWHTQWSTVEADFREIKALGVNTVRIHLQLGKFMEEADRPNERNLQQLAKLVQLAEKTGLYLDITGLGCYHKADIPAWYDTLETSARWEVQARFWQAVAKVCRESPAVFCYDLMNEPILPGKESAEGYLAGELGGKHFVQRLALQLGEQSREEMAQQWVKQLTTAIREVDEQHLITVGVIPWAQVFPGAKPLFYSPTVGEPLDFVSAHFYPKKGNVAGSLAALKVYEVGKPLVVEEIFPLGASLEETAEFIDSSREFTDGWISFYWGRTAEEYREQQDIQGAIIAAWLTWWQDNAPGQSQE